jgi:protein-tyrosine phosphatase
LPDYIDLHLHCLAGVDDGVRTIEEGLELCRGLHRLGFGKVIATPHIRTAMFDNRRPNLEEAFQQLREAASAESAFPELGLAAEHFWDDLFWKLFQEGESLFYPGEKAVLIEFPLEQIPLGIEGALFRMVVKGVRPVLAHPERYFPLARNSRLLEPLVKVGALALLDITALVGNYGRACQRAAERMLEEGLYYGASTDLHSPKDLERIDKSIARLKSLVGQSNVDDLLSAHPLNILEGRVGETERYD